MAAAYRRDVPLLLYWTFPDSRNAVAKAAADPEDPLATHALCRRLYRDLRDARSLPRFYRRRQDRIVVLRELFTAECRLYMQQRARTAAQAEMNRFLTRLAG